MDNMGMDRPRALFSKLGTFDGASLELKTTCRHLCVQDCTTGTRGSIGMALTPRKERHTLATVGFKVFCVGELAAKDRPEAQTSIDAAESNHVMSEAGSALPSKPNCGQARLYGSPPCEGLFHKNP